MKILLVKPISNIHVISPPLALGYIAASVKDQNVEVKILDCLLKKYVMPDFQNYIKQYCPDIIGFTSFTLEFKTALEMAKIAKAINPNVVIIFGGPHVSNSPEDSLQNNEIDFIFRGEAEESFPMLIKLLNKENNKKIKNLENELKKIPGLGWKNKNQIKDQNKITINPIKFIEDLDKLNLPDFDLMEFNQYPKLYLAKKHPCAPIITSRGCPFNCTFCTGGEISGKKWRKRSVESMISEIKLLKQKYNIQEFEIWDDNFTLDKERAKQFCDRLIEEHLNLVWWCPNGVRLETLDKELLIKMKKSGCYAIAFGIESGSEKIQKDMKKNLDFKYLEEMVNFAYKLGLRTQGFFIIGYPTETKEDIEKTIKLSTKLPLIRASFHLFQPLFGSEIYRILKKENKIPEGYLIEKCDYSKASILPIGFSSIDEVKKMQKKAMYNFYLRPRIFISFIKDNLSISQLKEMTLMVKKYILNK